MMAIKIQWLPRYSETMQPDKLGRWARVGYAGHFKGFGFFRCKVALWEIAWISKLKFKGEEKFLIQYKFPSNGLSTFDDLPRAKREVQKSFNWFIKMVTNG
jgi:hypothetical protein